MPGPVIQTRRTDDLGFEFLRYTDRVSFRCARCGQDKTVRNWYVPPSDASSVLCGGCYGFLVSQGGGQERASWITAAPSVEGTVGPDDLEPGETYTWDELGSAFGFKPAYLGAAGGMPVSAATNSVLLITHPGGGKSFDYRDHWEGADLIYVGRGKTGPQERTGPNLDVAENRRQLFAFEAAGPRQLKFFGRPVCAEERTGLAPDDSGELRSVLQFRLKFPDGEGRVFAAAASEPETVRKSGRASPERKPRPFDATRPPSAPAAPSSGLEPEELQAKQEKAASDHHLLIAMLDEWLRGRGWTDIEEIPAAIDLWGRAPDGRRVIFEGKTVGPSNELSQGRSGLAQLQEYRLEYGVADDELCLVVNAEVSVRRARILDSLGVGVLVHSAEGWRSANQRGSKLIELV